MNNEDLSSMSEAELCGEFILLSKHERDAAERVGKDFPLDRAVNYLQDEVRVLDEMFEQKEYGLVASSIDMVKLYAGIIKEVTNA